MKNTFCILTFAESMRTRVETGEVMSKSMLRGRRSTMARASKAPLRTAKVCKNTKNCDKRRGCRPNSNSQDL